jgi:hypothetical protein
MDSSGKIKINKNIDEDSKMKEKDMMHHGQRKAIDKAQQVLDLCKLI